MTSKRKNRGQVREPIQVYLGSSERARHERLARDLGNSRAEVLRRGLQSLERGEASSLYDALEPLVGAFSNPRAPTDLAERHDDYLAADLQARAARSRRRSS